MMAKKKAAKKKLYYMWSGNDQAATWSQIQSGNIIATLKGMRQARGSFARAYCDLYTLSDGTHGAIT